MPQTEAPGIGASPLTRLRWWTELPLIMLVYLSYSAGRLLARGDVSGAVDHGLAILRIEKVLLLNAEHPLNRLFTREAWLGVPADFWYASLHSLVTPAILVWLFRSRVRYYRAARTWLMTSTFMGLIGFTLLPTCCLGACDEAPAMLIGLKLYERPSAERIDEILAAERQAEAR